MPAGRPPKPISLKKLAGNPGKRALNESAPKVALGKPERAKWLRSTAGRRTFAKYTALMAAWLTPLDGVLVNAFCHHASIYELCAEKLNETGPVITETRASKSGELYTVDIVSPYWSIMNSTTEKLLSLAQKLAITVAERDKLMIALPPEKKDEMEEFLKQNKGNLIPFAPEIPEEEEAEAVAVEGDKIAPAESEDDPA